MTEMSFKEGSAVIAFDFNTEQFMDKRWILKLHLRSIDMLCKWLLMKIIVEKDTSKA